MLKNRESEIAKFESCITASQCRACRHGATRHALGSTDSLICCIFLRLLATCGKINNDKFFQLLAVRFSSSFGQNFTVLAFRMFLRVNRKIRMFYLLRRFFFAVFLGRALIQGCAVYGLFCSCCIRQQLEFWYTMTLRLCNNCSLLLERNLLKLFSIILFYAIVLQHFYSSSFFATFYYCTCRRLLFKQSQACKAVNIFLIFQKSKT